MTKWSAINVGGSDNKEHVDSNRLIKSAAAH